MNKNDYIKILREFQNNFKNEVNEDVIFFKECNYEERLEDISEQKNEYMCKEEGSIYTGCKIYFTYFKPLN